MTVGIKNTPLAAQNARQKIRMLRFLSIL